MTDCELHVRYRSWIPGLKIHRDYYERILDDILSIFIYVCWLINPLGKIPGRRNRCHWRPNSVEGQSESLRWALLVSKRKYLGTGRKKPEFPLELWNVYERVNANLARTNNSIEDWHNEFAKRVTIVHPTIKKLVDKIRREQSKFEIDIGQIRQGQELKPKKGAYRKFDEKSTRLVDDYGNVNLVEYLNGLAANVSL
jgi:hypothetical protein